MESCEPATDRAAMVYLDHNATTPFLPEVLDAMLPFLRESYGNPSSLHVAGQDARVAVDAAREDVARLIGAWAEEIVFTSGGTEADNTALYGAVDAAGSERNHIVVSAIEHEAVLHAADHVRDYRGCSVTAVPCDADGLVSPSAVAEAITDRTALVSVMHANNETGVVQPVAEIARMCGDRGVLMHTDAVQSVGKIPVDADALGVDLLSLSAHKIGGPKGVGALYVRRGTPFVPQQTGGAQERNRRAGTENVAGIVGFGAVARLALDSIDEHAKAMRTLRDRLEAGLRERISGVVVNGRAAQRLPNTLDVSFEGVDGESIPMALDVEGIAVSSGSACASGTFRPSHVLTAMGRSEELARAATRFSFGYGNTVADVDRVLAVLPGIIDRLREFARV